MAIEGRPVRWGILGCGNISRDFASAASALGAERSQFVACAARSQASAAKFAEEFKEVPCCEGIRALSSYDELVGDAEVDIVYIGTLADSHEELALKAIAAGKHVLVEKPIALDAAAAKRIVAAAREKGVFLMEGMWTRCFPATRKARELLASKVLGEVVTVSADFGWKAVEDPDGEHARLFLPKSGGACMDIGMYPLGHVLLATGGTKPANIAVAGSVVGREGAWADWTAVASLSGFAGKGSLAASVLVTLGGNTPEEAVFTCEKGTLRIEGKAHTPTRLTLTKMASRTESTVETFDFPLPATPPKVAGWKYPGSEGFLYEAEAVVSALQQGLKECPEWTHGECVLTMELVEEFRRQVMTSAAKL